MRKQYGIAPIPVVVGVLVIIVILGFLYFKFLNKKPTTSSTSGSVSSSESLLKEEYSNPFEEESQYQNPFAESDYQNPFE